MAPLIRRRGARWLLGWADGVRYRARRQPVRQHGARVLLTGPVSALRPGLERDPREIAGSLWACLWGQRASAAAEDRAAEVLRLEARKTRRQARARARVVSAIDGRAASANFTSYLRHHRPRICRFHVRKTRRPPVQIKNFIRVQTSHFYCRGRATAPACERFSYGDLPA